MEYKKAEAETGIKTVTQSDDDTDSETHIHISLGACVLSKVVRSNGVPIQQ